MTHRLILILMLVFATPMTCFATCEEDLRALFSQTPNDEKDGFVTDQTPMTEESLAVAYSMGLWSWSVTEEGNARWYSAPTRTILPFDEVDISRSDLKAMRKLDGYRVTFDQDFAGVMRGCFEQDRVLKVIDEKNGQVVEIKKNNKWITEQHIAEYTKLAAQGKAHSIEVWNANNELVAGMYGVFVNGYFSGESMFHKENDVVKLAYSALIERLRANGHTFLDAQQNRGLTKKWGGRDITRDEFQAMIQAAGVANKPF